jgi:hypothetical protein
MRRLTIQDDTRKDRILRQIREGPTGHRIQKQEVLEIGDSAVDPILCHGRAFQMSLNVKDWRNFQMSRAAGDLARNIGNALEAKLEKDRLAVPEDYLKRLVNVEPDPLDDEPNVATGDEILGMEQL